MSIQIFQIACRIPLNRNSNQIEGTWNQFRVTSMVLQEQDPWGQVASLSLASLSWIRNKESRTLKELTGHFCMTLTRSSTSRIAWLSSLCNSKRSSRTNYNPKSRSTLACTMANWRRSASLRIRCVTRLNSRTWRKARSSRSWRTLKIKWH